MLPAAPLERARGGWRPACPVGESSSDPAHDTLLNVQCQRADLTRESPYTARIMTGMSLLFVSETTFTEALTSTAQ
jgi:hypothetical protein